MGQYYQLDNDDAPSVREEESIYGRFSQSNPFHIQRALKRNSLHQAVCNSDYDEADSVLNLGRTNVNQQDIHGNAALHLAIVNQDSFPSIYAKRVHLLHEHKADDHIKNAYGQSPLDLDKENVAERKKYALMFDLPPPRQPKDHPSH